MKQVENEPRDMSLIQEQIDDINRYLNGLPEGLRGDPAFLSYEQLLVSLKLEFINSWCQSFEKLNDRIKTSPSSLTQERVDDVAKFCAVTQNSVPRLMAH